LTRKGQTNERYKRNNRNVCIRETHQTLSQVRYRNRRRHSQYRLRHEGQRIDAGNDNFGEGTLKIRRCYPVKYRKKQ
jgi:hypothetical protein